MSLCLKDLMAETICETQMEMLVKMNTVLHFMSCIFRKMGFTQGRIDNSRDFGK